MAHQAYIHRRKRWFDYNVTLSNPTTEFNLYDALVATGWDERRRVRAIISVEAAITSSSIEIPAFSIPELSHDSYVRLVVQSWIAGKGGAGGISPEDGGTALYLRHPISLLNAGAIAGGGGGGRTGSTTTISCEPDKGGNTQCNSGGGGGGGGGAGNGAGANGRSGGCSGFIECNSNVSGASGEDGGGPGGSGGSGGSGGCASGCACDTACGEDGGNGGNFGQSGGNNGGSSGLAIDGSNFVTSFTNPGVLLGPVTSA